MQAACAPIKTNYALLLCIIARTFFINFQCILKPVVISDDASGHLSVSAYKLLYTKNNQLKPPISL
jgi:hypothetical protein